MVPLGLGNVPCRRCLFFFKLYLASYTYHVHAPAHLGAGDYFITTVWAMYIHSYACIFVCVYVHTHTHRQTDTHTHTHTYTHRNVPTKLAAELFNSWDVVFVAAGCMHTVAVTRLGI